MSRLFQSQVDKCIWNVPRLWKFQVIRGFFNLNAIILPAFFIDNSSSTDPWFNIYVPKKGRSVSTAVFSWKIQHNYLRFSFSLAHQNFRGRAVSVRLRTKYYRSCGLFSAIGTAFPLRKFDFIWYRLQLNVMFWPAKLNQRPQDTFSSFCSWKCLRIETRVALFFKVCRVKQIKQKLSVGKETNQNMFNNGWKVGRQYTSVIMAIKFHTLLFQRLLAFLTTLPWGKFKETLEPKSGQ